MFLCNYTEYGSDNGISMKEHFEPAPYEGQDVIVNYLRHIGKPTSASTKIPTDRLTGERIKGEIEFVFYSDGVFRWVSDLAYHVEKYNLRLPKEFEDHVLNYFEHLDDNKEESAKKAV